MLFAVVLFTFQHLLGQLLVSEERAEELERRTRQLASLQVGLLSALLHTLDLRDRMTARHSAAVARYSKEIARAAGFSEEEQDLVHTAALLHDVGKFIFPDRILKGDNKLTEEDWNIIRMHPYQGARIVSQIEGYGPVGEIIIAHHERMDGKGYPRHLKGDEIPMLSRIISVSDIYDVMTARDSYRKPISSFEAIRELRRVSGTQLDGHLVEVFIEVLSGKDVRYRHGEDADFDAELALEKRVHDYAALELPEDLTAEADATEDSAGRAGRCRRRGTRLAGEARGRRPQPTSSSPSVELAGVAQVRGRPLGRLDVDADAGAELEPRELGQARHDVDPPVIVRRIRVAPCAATCSTAVRRRAPASAAAAPRAAAAASTGSASTRLALCLRGTS